MSHLTELSTKGRIWLTVPRAKVLQRPLFRQMGGVAESLNCRLDLIDMSISRVGGTAFI